MKYLIMFENYQNEKFMELDDKTREEYIKKLEDLASFPELYNNDLITWIALIDRTPSKYLDSEEMSISKSEYNKYLRQYQKILQLKPHQIKLDSFLQGISGELPDTDFDELNDKPIEWWIEDFKGFPKEVAYLAKSVWDYINIFPIEFIRIK